MPSKFSPGRYLKLMELWCSLGGGGSDYGSVEVEKEDIVYVCKYLIIRYLCLYSVNYM